MLTGVILSGGNEEQVDLQSPNSIKLLPNVNKQINEMQTICDEVIIVTNQPRLFLPAVPREVRIITDYYKHSGPLCGIHAGMSLAKNQHIWVVSANSPMISGKAAEAMLPLFKDDKELAVFPWINHRPFFYHSLYKKDMLPIIEKLVTAHKTDPVHLLDRVPWSKAEFDYFKQHHIDTGFITETMNSYW